MSVPGATGTIFPCVSYKRFILTGRHLLLPSVIIVMARQNTWYSVLIGSPLMTPNDNQSLENPVFTKEQLEQLLARSDRQFQREYLGTFLEEEEDPLLEVAETYFRHCWSYDLKVCTARRDGEPVPANNEEWILINRHALEEKRRLMHLYNLTGKQFHQALVRYNKRFPYIKTNYEEERRTFLP